MTLLISFNPRIIDKISMQFNHHYRPIRFGRQQKLNFTTPSGHTHPLDATGYESDAAEHAIKVLSD
jgi:hypothetical protein